MIDLGLFVILIAQMSHSLRLALLAGIGTLLALQLRKPHDAILGDTLQLPVTFALVLFALLAFLQYSRANRRFWLGLALVCEIAACCIHEAAYPLALLFPIVGSTASWTRRAGALFIIAPALLLAFALLTHHGIPASLI
jgi:hypothetical protein